MTRYIPFLDKHLPPLHDPVLELDPRMVFCAPTDNNQLIPCHNPQFRHPQGRDPVWNAAHARNRRKYTDKTAQARSEEHTSELQTLMLISYAVFHLQKTNIKSKKRKTTKRSYENDVSQLE